MLPALTASPPKRLSPSRFDCESRPLRVLPPAFLCAISIRSRSGSALDAGHLNPRVRLAVTLHALVALAPPELHDSDLAPLPLLLHDGSHFAAGEVGRADAHAAVVGDEQNLVELDGRA